LEDSVKNVHARPLPAFVLLAVSFCGAAAADTFPPVTEAERALTAVPGEPNAPAVILFKKATLTMNGFSLAEYGASHLLVQVREKILTDEGARTWGEATVLSSEVARIRGFTGRTVLPDGNSVAVPADAQFRRKLSAARGVFVSSLAFPAVQRGAILDYQYELTLRWGSMLEPWYFAADVPVLHSEINFRTSGEQPLRPWRRDPFRIGLKTETGRGVAGWSTRMWADNVPAVRNDPNGPPFSDLALQIAISPWGRWGEVCPAFLKMYRNAQHKSGEAAEKARSVAGQGNPREKALRLFHFVRDEIATDEESGVFFEAKSVGNVLAQRHGRQAEKSVLLQTLLRETGVDSVLVWAADRRLGLVDLSLVSPFWFDRILVALDLEGQRVYLDPGERGLDFGQIAPWYEGTTGLPVDESKIRAVALPETPFDQSARKAVVDLTLDAAGRLTGTGELVLTGNHAYERIGWKEDATKTAEAWKDWLGDQLKDFKVTDVKVEESPDDRKVRLTWSLQQREDEVLGDEATLAPSRPLGPRTQLFVQDADQRRSPVLFPYADRDEVELRVRWPQGWTVNATPQPAHEESPQGDFSVSVESDAAGRTLVYRRRLDIKQKLLAHPQEYEKVRALYAAVEKSDAQALSLVRR
jgi:hypothetical protein